MSVVWARRAIKELARLDEPAQDRVLEAVTLLAESRRGDVRRLQGMREELYRLRVGDWRVIFGYGSDRTIQVHRVRPRGGAYRI